MSKSNPTTRPDALNYEVIGNMIHRYERMDIAEAFGVLSQVKNPLCGFRDADFQPWVKSRLHYVHPTAAEPFRTKSEKFQQCARITAEDPRKVPEGVPELPEPWLAYVGKGHDLPICQNPSRCDWPYRIRWNDEDYWSNGVDGSHVGHCHAIDVRTAFAREHFPEYVEALGYPMESTIADATETDDAPDEATALENALKQITPEFTARETWNHIWQSGRDYERANNRDTQLLDKLEENEYAMPDNSQRWEVFTDAGDPKMTVREAIEAWGADE